MGRIVRTLAAVALVTGSLLTFPQFVSWMVAAWIGIAVVALWRRKAWPILLSVSGLLLIKQTGYTLELFVLLAMILLVAYFDWHRRHTTSDDSPKTPRTPLVAAVVLLLAAAQFGILRYFESTTSFQRTPDQRPIACLGDSLTAYGYPQQLKKLIAAPIADFGVNGITTDDGIAMLPEIFATNPQALVLELGGHDYNADHKTRLQLRRNLVKIIDACHARKIAVILVEIPRGFITDPYSGVERELSREYDLQLVDDTIIRRFIFFSPIVPPGMWLAPDHHLSKDGLHPNAKGNLAFAHAVKHALVRVFGTDISQN